MLIAPTLRMSVEPSRRVQTAFLGGHSVTMFVSLRDSSAELIPLTNLVVTARRPNETGDLLTVDPSNIEEMPDGQWQINALLDYPGDWQFEAAATDVGATVYALNSCTFRCLQPLASGALWPDWVSAADSAADAAASAVAADAAGAAAGTIAGAAAAAPFAATATTQAGIATTQAGIALGHATTATTQAGIATTQAGIATTKAAESSASSVEAATVRRSVAVPPSDPTLWNVQRGSDRYQFGADKVLYALPQSNGQGEVAWDHDALTGQPLGPALGGERQQRIRNSWAIGGVDGIIGSGGTPPTNWTASVPPAPLVFTRLGVVTRFGIPCMLYSMVGTPSATASYDVGFEASNVSRAAQNDIVSLSCFVGLEAGSTSGITMILRGQGRTSAGVGLAAYTGPNVIAAVTSLAGGFPRHRLTYTMADATAVYAGSGVRFGFTSGVPVNATFAIGLPQMEVARFVSAPILPLPGTLTTFPLRAADLVTIEPADLGNRWSPLQGTIVMDVNSQSGAFTGNPADWFGLLSLDDGTDANLLGMILSSAHTSLEGRITQGGVAGTNASVALTAPLRDATFRVALAWNASQMQVAARGTAGTAQAISGALPPMTRIRLGGLGTGFPGFIRIPGLDVQPAALFGSSLAALT